MCQSRKIIFSLDNANLKVLETSILVKKTQSLAIDFFYNLAIMNIAWHSHMHDDICTVPGVVYLEEVIIHLS